jgi:hypothetical protein
VTRTRYTSVEIPPNPLTAGKPKELVGRIQATRGITALEGSGVWLLDMCCHVRVKRGLEGNLLILCWLFRCFHGVFEVWK